MDEHRTLSEKNNLQLGNKVTVKENELALSNSLLALSLLIKDANICFNFSFRWSFVLAELKVS